MPSFVLLHPRSRVGCRGRGDVSPCKLVFCFGEGELFILPDHRVTWRLDRALMYFDKQINFALSCYLLLHVRVMVCFEDRCPRVLGVASPFFPAIVLFNNQPFPRVFGGFLERFGSLEVTPRRVSPSSEVCWAMLRYEGSMVGCRVAARARPVRCVFFFLDVGVGQNETTREPQVLVFVSICQGSILGTCL